MDQLTGTVKSIRGPYKNGWCILKVHPGNQTVTGCIPSSLNTGDVCKFEGKWKESDQWGKQFNIKKLSVEEPQGEVGLKNYLSNNFSQIGPTIGKRIIAEFGDDLFTVLENTPEKLAKIQGITPKFAEVMGEEYKKIRAMKEIDLFFNTHNITANMQGKLVEKYKSIGNAHYAVKTNPYRLIEDIHGVAFKKADSMAMSIGIKKNAFTRIKAGLLYCLQEAQSAGHCYLSETDFMAKAVSVLNLPQKENIEVLEVLVDESQIILSRTRYYLPELFMAEQFVAENLSCRVEKDHIGILHDLTEEDFQELDDDQKLALELSLSKKISIITGGPGVGKTYTINMILKAIGSDKEVALAAPTGKAAKRMQECTGKDALTIHRLLKFHPFEGWGHNAENPIEADVLIIDETSMIDISLMQRLLVAVPLSTQIIFVGDNDQLPSVGAGNVLNDMIVSGAIPVSHLKTLHRQAAESFINLNAKLINVGEKLTFTRKNLTNQDFWHIVEENSAKIPEQIVNICDKITTNLDFGLDDIQILCPQKKTAIGTFELNKVLRDRVFNPEKHDVKGTFFKLYDRVIQLKNNYKLGIYNGDIGRIADASHGHMTIEFDEGESFFEVNYPVSNADDLSLAYALTIHKSQGSEFPVVIIPVHTTNWIMLKRNLLYTAVTRGKQMVVLVGTQKAINTAIRTLDSHVRFTGLAERIKDYASLS